MASFHRQISGLRIRPFSLRQSLLGLVCLFVLFYTAGDSQRTQAFYSEIVEGRKEGQQAAYADAWCSHREQRSRGGDCRQEALRVADTGAPQGGVGGTVGRTAPHGPLPERQVTMFGDVEVRRLWVSPSGT